MKIRVTNGCFWEGTHYSKDKQYNVTQSEYEAIEQNVEVLEPKYSYEQNGTWFTVFLNGKQIDKFQGKDKLEDYGLAG